MHGGTIGGMGTQESPVAAVKVGSLSHHRASSIECPAGFSLRRLSITDWPVLDPITESGTNKCARNGEGDSGQTYFNRLLHKASPTSGQASVTYPSVGEEPDKVGKENSGLSVVNPYLADPGEAPSQSRELNSHLGKERGQPKMADSLPGKSRPRDSSLPQQIKGPGNVFPFLQEPTLVSQKAADSNPFLVTDGRYAETVNSSATNVRLRESTSRVETSVPRPPNPPAQETSLGSKKVNALNPFTVNNEERRSTSNGDVIDSLDASIQGMMKHRALPDGGDINPTATEKGEESFEGADSRAAPDTVGSIPEGLRSIQTEKLRTRSIDSSTMSFPPELLGNGLAIQQYPTEGNLESMFSPGALTSQGSVDDGLDESAWFEMEYAKREAEQEVAQLKLQLRSKTQQLEQVQEVLLIYEEEIMTLRKEVAEGSMRSDSETGASTCEEGGQGEDHNKHGLKERGFSISNSSADGFAVSLDTAEALSSKIVELQQKVQDLEQDLIKSKLENVEVLETNEFLRSMVNKKVKSGSRKGIFARTQTN